MNAAQATQHPLDKLCEHLYDLAESQRETNTLLTHLMQKPVTQNFLSYLPNITYIKGSHSILISSQAKQLKKLWCTTCKKKSLVNVNPQQHTAKSQCGHLKYCQECTIEIHQKIIRCSHCVPFLHPTPIRTDVDKLSQQEEGCPVCSANLKHNFLNTSREQNVFDRLFTDYYIVVDTQDPNQCTHNKNIEYIDSVNVPKVGIKRERDWNDDVKQENQPKRFAIANKINEGLIPKVRDGVLGMSKMAMEVGSNFLTRLSELDEEEEDPFFDGLL